ncbi:ClpXP protease specificity-enhancing factor [Haemophilus influenzae]|uniref:ClpXP protease specificity-enhancing factor n=1 Tax=Haemophilus influenzae TaxID=727 RepID=A0A2X1PSY0_HAEIF|nr:ClpXP protease specificity-enhancing factor [Haemophilus influenzae]
MMKLNIEPDTEQPTGFYEAVDKPKKREEKKKTKSVSHLRIVD